MTQSSSENRFSARAPMMLGGVALAFLLGGFGLWATMTEIAGAVVASGQIEVDRNRQVVQHPDGGVIADLLVDEGDLVAQDQLVMRLDPTELQSQLAITEAQLFEIMARRGRLEAEQNSTDIQFDPELLAVSQTQPEVRAMMDGQIHLLEARNESIAQETRQLERRQEQIRSQIIGIRAQKEALRQQLELIQQELNSQQRLLDSGLSQATKVLNLQRQQARLSGEVAELDAQQAQSEGRITEIDIEVLKLESNRREQAVSQLRDLQYRELEQAETRRALQLRLSRMDIRAPVSGIVYALQFTTPRSVVRPADPVLYLVPQDRPLVIAAQVPTTDVDQVYPGQNVTLRLPALDQRTTPELTGTVAQVSADAFMDEASRASYYRAEIAVSADELAKLPAGVTLLPGMPVEAYIRTADRTPLAYLVKPLSDYFARAFREG